MALTVRQSFFLECRSLSGVADRPLGMTRRLLLLLEKRRLLFNWLAMGGAEASAIVVPAAVLTRARGEENGADEGLGRVYIGNRKGCNVRKK